MSKCWHVIMFALSLYHVSNAGKLTQQCKASNGRCGINTYSSCCDMYGSGWTDKGRCCGRRPCCVFQCEDIQIQNGRAILNGTGVGSTATFSCENGYRLLGNKLLTCTKNGWNDYIPVCLVQCEDLQIQNGKAIRNVTAAGSTATFSCDIGYSLLGNKLLTCTENGWSDYIPVCFACPETVVKFGGSTYKFNCGGFNWYQAEEYCKSQGGNLATIETREENNFLKYVVTLIKTTGAAFPNHWWIGLTDIKTEGSFEWISGHPLSYTDWYQGRPRQPDNVDNQGRTTNVDCASLAPRISFQWIDDNCVKSNACQAFCEIWSVFIHIPT